MTDSAAETWATWRAARLASVTSVRGEASLVSTNWLTDDWAEIDGVPGRWRRDGDDAALYRAHVGDAAPTTFTAFEFPSAVERPAGALRLTRETVGHAHDSAVTVVPWPGIGVAIRLWDRAHAGELEIDAFGYDPAFVFTGRFHAQDGQLDYDYLGHGGRVEKRATAGDLQVTIGDQEYRIAVTHGTRGHEAVFADETNGLASYARGRFVPIEVHADGTAAIDFNAAYLPPCAFSAAFDCPLAPPQNRLRAAISAGERRVVRH